MQPLIKKPPPGEKPADKGPYTAKLGLFAPFFKKG
jgi:hypothetical protein